MDKASLRALMREHGPVPPGVSARIVDGLFAWLSPRLPGTISAFLPMEGEVDLRSLFDRLPGWRWVLPRVEDDRSVTFRDLAVPRETPDSPSICAVAGLATGLGIMTASSPRLGATPSASGLHQGHGSWMSSRSSGTMSWLAGWPPRMA